MQTAFLAVCGLLIAGALVWAVWRLDPAWVFCAGLAAMMFSGHWTDLGFPSGIPLKPDRLLLVVAFGMVVLRTPGARDRPPIRLTPIHGLLALTLVYAFFSAWAAGTLSDQAALFGLIDRFGLLPFLAFAIAPAMFHTAAQRRVLVGTLVVLGGYLGITAVFEITNFKAGVFPSYIMDPNVGITFGRARGPFAQSSALGLVLFASLVACALALSAQPAPRTRNILYLVAAFCLAGTFMTLTRSAWIAAVGATAVVSVFSPAIRRRAVPLALVAAAGVGLAFVAIPGLHDRTTARTEDQRPIWDRYNSNAAALRIVDQRPLFGVGWGRYHEVNGQYLRQSDSYPLTGVGLEVHNVALGNTAELGLVGGLLWAAAILGAVFAPMLRRLPAAEDRWRLALIAVSTNWLLVAMFVPLGYPLPNMLIWLLAGVVVGLRPPAPEPVPSWLQRVLRGREPAVVSS